MHLNWNAPWQHAGDPVRGGDDAKSSIEQGKAQPNAPYARLAEMVTRARYKGRVQYSINAGSSPASCSSPQRANVEVKIDGRLTDLKVIYMGD